MSNALGGVAIRCTADQFNFLVPPSGQDCLSFLAPYTAAATGYAEVVDGQCGYCAVRLSLTFTFDRFAIEH